MFLKKVFKGTERGNEIHYTEAKLVSSSQDYLAAKEQFEKLGFARNISLPIDGYGDLNRNDQTYYGINGVAFKKPNR